MKRIVAMVVAVVMVACMPYTFFPGQPEWFKLDASWAAPGHSGDGGNNGNHSGSGGGGNAGQGQGGGNGGQGGGQGGNGGGSHGGGSHGGGEGHGGGTTGGGSSPAAGATGDAGGVSAGGGTLTLTGGQGISKAAREKLMDVVKACEMERPGLALGDTTSTGGWSFRTYDDTVWPYVQRCMKAAGYPAYGIDYSETSNFGTR